MARPKGGYKLKNGATALGVTTVINRFDETGGLLYWAFEQGKAYERGEIGGLYEKRDEAANAGTLAHDLVEAHIKGQDTEKILDETKSPDKVVQQAINAFLAYKRWAAQSKLEIMETEIPLVSEKYGFGGCIDAVGKFDTMVILLDWKTGKGVYKGHLVQLAAYEMLWNENYPKYKITGGAHLVRFDKVNGDFSHKHFSGLSNEWEYFKTILKLWPIDKAIGQRVK